MSYLIFLLLGIYPIAHATDEQSIHSKTEQTQEDTTLVKMEIHGLYEHRNLFISNPILASGSRCITRAPELNGSPMAKITDANALEIKLSEYDLELGDVIKLVIWHSPECKPVLINPEVIDPEN
jgi:hypothetical protein